MSNKLLQTIAIIMMLVGYGLVSFPFISDQYSRIGQTASIVSYEKTMEAIEDDGYTQIQQACDIYNQKIAEKQQEEYYHYDDTTNFSEDYLSWPVSGSDIGTLYIPDLNITLPIGHGTSDETLQVKAGHLYGTSLPCGGESTHAVISGHSGLRTAEMFDNLSDLKIGDKAYIKISNRVLEYTVREINIVLPQEHDQYMQIEQGKDLLTLYTCTPYGINSHRLLVKCEHTDTEIIEAEKQMEMVNIKVDSLKPKIIIGSMIVIPVAIAGVALYFVWKKED